MPIAVTGSVATDHLMSYPGRFADSILVDKLDRIAVSFLVDDLQIRRGGCAANIAFGLAALGARPVLVAAVGQDFAEYRSWLERHHVDCGSVAYSQTRHTARFVCTTDAAQAQIASFYPGAMSEARDIELGAVAGRVGGLQQVIIAPNDPAAMLRHTDECRERGLPFVADPSQQLSSSDGPTIRRFISGAAVLLSNEYEAALIEQKTGWASSDILEEVDIRVVTLGASGARVERRGEEAVTVAAVAGIDAVEPTGVGDAFRAGFVATLQAGQDVRQAARVGCVLASYVVEVVGTQEYTFTTAQFLDRMSGAYSADAAAEVSTWVDTPASFAATDG